MRNRNLVLICFLKSEWNRIKRGLKIFEKERQRVRFYYFNMIIWGRKFYLFWGCYFWEMLFGRLIKHGMLANI